MMFLSGPRILRFWKSFGNRHGTDNFLVFETPNRRKTPKDYNKTHVLCGLIFKKRLRKVMLLPWEFVARFHQAIVLNSVASSLRDNWRLVDCKRSLAQPREAPLKKKQLLDSLVGLKMEHMIAYATFLFLKREHDDKLLKLYKPI